MIFPYVSASSVGRCVVERCQFSESENRTIPPTVLLEAVSASFLFSMCLSDVN